MAFSPGQTVPEERWDADEFGNHRADVHVNQAAEAVKVHLPWRRRDDEVADKKIIVTGSRPDQVVNNVVPVRMTPSEGLILFQPAYGPGVYHIYYMPFSGTVTSPYPKIDYDRHEETADPDWVERHGLRECAEETLEGIPDAACTGFTSVNDFSAFTVMEQPATADELEAMLEAHAGKPFLIFPETRDNPIRMQDRLPFRWVDAGPSGSFSAEAMKGEFFVFQIGVYAQKDLQNVRLTFPMLTTDAAEEVAIESARFRCFNSDGIGWDGRAFQKRIDIPSGRIQALWLGVDIAESSPPGVYRGAIVLSADDVPVQALDLELIVTDEVIEVHGDDQPERLSRLRWLDSTIGRDDTVPRPFTPVELDHRTVGLLGREIDISHQGLPQQIRTFFNVGNTGIGRDGREILASPITFVIDDASGASIPPHPVGEIRAERHDSYVRWTARSEAGTVRLSVDTTLEFDGAAEFQVGVEAAQDTDVNDMRLEIECLPEFAAYMLGLGIKGGFRKPDIAWKWDVEKNHDAVWVGAVNGGLQVQLKDENYSRPLNTNFYHLKPLVMPASWDNDGRGGITITDTPEHTVLLRCYSGPRRIETGETLYFNFRLLITPFKPVDTAGHFNTRYYHKYAPAEEAVEAGANTINIHHASDINPWINYPSLCPEDTGAYIDEAHEKGCRVKLYYTVRELTTRAPELFALHSLNSEILVDGAGGGHSWLQEHLAEHYIAAWYARRVRDTSVINGVLSRWHNFYVEGLDWMARNLGIDGLYLDDLGFGREVLQRLRRVLARHRPDPEIDLHSANQYNEKDGFASSMNLYLDCLPYLDRLWFGEYFDYNETPDYWLIELSGIPFGLMNEMLQDGGNAWRGMVYGMTGRAPRVDNKAQWAFWDSSGLPASRMLGYWHPACPVSVDHDHIKSTAYLGEDRAVIAVANWTDTEVEGLLHIDWPAMPVAQENAVFSIPFIEGFQDAVDIADISQPLKLAPSRGLLIVVE